MPVRSAGILLHRRRDGEVEVLLVHPGGPFWARRDEGAWSIPKGEAEPDEGALATARREFREELGTPVPDGEVIDLGEIMQRGGKRVRAYAVAGDLDAASVVSSLCEIAWPPRSGRTLVIPEIDEARWFALGEARRKILPAQVELIERLDLALRGGRSPR